MKIVNLTPHDVVVKNKYGEEITYPKSGCVARAISRYNVYSELEHGVPVEKEMEPDLDFGIEIDPFTVYIVSYQFAMKLKFIDHKYKHQFVYPSSCKAERDSDKQVLNVPSLISIGY